MDSKSRGEKAGREAYEPMVDGVDAGKKPQPPVRKKPKVISFIMAVATAITAAYALYGVGDIPAAVAFILTLVVTYAFLVYKTKGSDVVGTALYMIATVLLFTPIIHLISSLYSGEISSITYQDSIWGILWGAAVLTSSAVIAVVGKMVKSSNQ
ncbi:MAG: hypothetical protein ABEK59_02665 [Halobacteria archaeon]